MTHQPSAEDIELPTIEMIKTLQDCVKRETSYPGRPYGPSDVRGSLLGLYKRGLVDVITSHNNKLRSGSWYVTEKGLNLLTAISSGQVGYN